MDSYSSMLVENFCQSKVIFDVCIGRDIAKKFGKSIGFGVGLGLLPIVFAPVLAFGKAEFQEREYI